MDPEIGDFQQFEVLNIKCMPRKPTKAHSWPKRRFDIFCIKYVQVCGLERNGGTSKTSKRMAKSRILGAKNLQTDRKKIRLPDAIHDVIASTKFS